MHRQVYMSEPSSLPRSNFNPMATPGGQIQHPTHNVQLRACHEGLLWAHSHQVATVGRSGHGGLEGNGGNLVGQDSVEKDSPPSLLREQGP